MASIFRRMFKVAESHAHSAMDNLEDPIKMTEQGIRDLKKNLQAAMVLSARPPGSHPKQALATSTSRRAMAPRLMMAPAIMKKGIATNSFFSPSCTTPSMRFTCVAK